MCKNKYCPIEYKPDEKPCKDCKFNEVPKVDLPPEFQEIFGKKDKK